MWVARNVKEKSMSLRSLFSVQSHIKSFIYTKCSSTNKLESSYFALFLQLSNPEPSFPPQILQPFWHLSRQPVSSSPALQNLQPALRKLDFGFISSFLIFLCLIPVFLRYTHCTLRNHCILGLSHSTCICHRFCLKDFPVFSEHWPSTP